MKKLLALIVLSLFVFAPVSFAAPGALDGKTFTGAMLKKGDKKADPDTFIFKSGTFRSTACDQYGYKEGTYSATAGKDKTTFTAVTKNTNGATMNWTGAIKGRKINGTAKMTDSEGKTMEFTFHGKTEEMASTTKGKAKHTT